MTRARTPNGSVSVGTIGVSGGQAEKDRTVKSRHDFGDDGAHRRIAVGLVASRHLAEDDGGGPAEQAAQPQLHQQPVDAERALADLVEKQHVPVGGAKANGVPSDAINCVSVPPRSMPPASPGAMTLDLRMRDLTCRLGSAETPRERVAIVAGSTPGQAPFDHRAMERDDAALQREPAENRCVVAVADECLGVCAR